MACFLQGVLSRACFRRAAACGQKVFTILSLHISNIHAKKKGIAKKIIQTIRALMVSQDVDFVAGDFNGTAWRCRSRDEVFSDCLAYTILGTRIQPAQMGSQRFSKVNQHGAFSIPPQALGFTTKRSKLPS